MPSNIALDDGQADRSRSLLILLCKVVTFQF